MAHSPYPGHTYACPATKKGYAPRTMDPSMTTPLIVKSGQNYAYTRFTGGRRPLWATGTYVQGVDPQKGLANQC